MSLLATIHKTLALVGCSKGRTQPQCPEYQIPDPNSPASFAMRLSLHPTPFHHRLYLFQQVRKSIRFNDHCQSARLSQQMLQPLAQLTVVHTRREGLVDLPLPGVARQCNDQLECYVPLTLRISDLLHRCKPIHHWGRISFGPSPISLCPLTRHLQVHQDNVVRRLTLMRSLSQPFQRFLPITRDWNVSHVPRSSHNQG